MEADSRMQAVVPAEPSGLEKRLVGALVKAVFFRGRRGGPWPVPEGLDATALRIRGNSGASLAALHVRASPATSAKGSALPQGIVVLAHPDRRYGKQWFLREGWVEWLTAHGFDALLFDFPMYGGSRGGSTYLHDDVIAACRKAQELRPGLPVHLVGLSLGSFASINASPHLGFLASMTLESPYPTFDAWYADRGGGHGRANRLFGKLFPTTYRRIDAGRNMANNLVPRILVAASRDDEVTPAALSKAVAQAGPHGNVLYLELTGPHLGLFQHEAYRTALLGQLRAARPGPGRSNVLEQIPSR